MSDEAETDIEEAKHIAKTVMSWLKVENGVIRAEDLRRALNELIDPADGGKAMLVLPDRSLAHAFLGNLVIELRREERLHASAEPLTPTMEI